MKPFTRDLAKSKDQLGDILICHQMAVIDQKIDAFFSLQDVGCCHLNEKRDRHFAGWKMRIGDLISESRSDKRCAGIMPQKVDIIGIDIDTKNAVAMLFAVVQIPERGGRFSVTHGSYDGCQPIFFDLSQIFLHTLGNIYRIDVFFISWHFLSSLSMDCG